MTLTQLDFTTLDDTYFPSIAQILLNESYLLINKKKYRLVEIEFYLNCQAHIDPYTHNDKDQMLAHTFYFHKFKNGTYKAGTFKGMDLIFGDIKEKAYFGILVRSIEDMESGNFVEGPCNVVNKILNLYDCDSIIDFTGSHNLEIFKNKKNFVLKISENIPQQEIFWGPRIGLSAKYPKYQNRMYRYTNNKDKIKKRKTSLVKMEVIEV